MIVLIILQMYFFWLIYTTDAYYAYIQPKQLFTCPIMMNDIMNVCGFSNTVCLNAEGHSDTDIQTQKNTKNSPSTTSIQYVISDNLLQPYHLMYYCFFILFSKTKDFNIKQ